MPPKRPAPLSDAAFSKKEGGTNAAAALAPGAELGELNEGVPLVVKNTFIDGSGLTPRQTPKKDPLRTAPAQVNFAPGFVQRSVLAANLQPPPPAEEVAEGEDKEDEKGDDKDDDKDGDKGDTDSDVTEQVGDSARSRPATLQLPPSSGGRGPGVVQRPGFQDWPLETPSPTGSSMFAAARYQLFGGPAPVQEATYSAMGPGSSQPQPQSGVLATQGPMGVHAPLGPIPSRGAMVMPLSYGNSTFATSAPGSQSREAVSRAAGTPAVAPSGPLSTGAWLASHSATSGPSSPAKAAPAVPPPPHAPPAAATPPAPAGPPAAPPAAAPAIAAEVKLRSSPLTRVEQEGSDEEADDDSDAEAAQQQSGRSVEDAPKPPPGAEHPSKGSENHSEATCKRCCFFPRNRCNNGYECDFCHYEHEKRKRKNKKSKKKNKGGNTEEGAAEGAAQGEGDTPQKAREGGGSAAVPEAGASAENGPFAGAADLWSIPYPGAAPPMPGVETWQDPLYPRPPAAAPHVVYDNGDGSPHWTYQWIDDPRAFPGPFPETVPSYFAPATGAEHILTPNSLAPVQPLYAQPPIHYPGSEGWASPPQPFPGTADTAAWHPPFPAPAYPAMGIASPQRPQAGMDSSVNSPSSPTSLAPPPMEAPRLPRVVQSQFGDTAPPPQGAPTLPPTVEVSEEEIAKPPPPVSSPRLSNNVLMSLQEKEPPPVPGDVPI